MAAIEFNWKPSLRQLRQFGVVSLFALPLLGWLFAGMPPFDSWTGLETGVIGGLAGAGIVLAVSGWVAPAIVRTVFIGACLLAYPIGLVLSEVILLAIYMLVFTPMAVFFRIIGRDSLGRTIDRNAKSYWEPMAPPRDARSYYRQS